MTLADLRKLAIRNRLRIRFRLPNGMECVLTEQGIAQVPELHGVPDFNLERELAAVGQFVLEPLPVPGRKPERPRVLSAPELAAMAGSGAADRVHPDEHDE